MKALVVLLGFLIFTTSPAHALMCQSIGSTTFCDGTMIQRFGSTTIVTGDQRRNREVEIVVPYGGDAPASVVTEPTRSPAPLGICIKVNGITSCY